MSEHIPTKVSEILEDLLTRSVMALEGATLNGITATDLEKIHHLAQALWAVDDIHDMKEDRLARSARDAVIGMPHWVKKIYDDPTFGRTHAPLDGQKVTHVHYDEVELQDAATLKHQQGEVEEPEEVAKKVEKKCGYCGSTKSKPALMSDDSYSQFPCPSPFHNTTTTNDKE